MVFQFQIKFRTSYSCTNAHPTQRGEHSAGAKSMSTETVAIPSVRARLPGAALLLRAMLVLEAWSGASFACTDEDWQNVADLAAQNAAAYGGQMIHCGLFVVHNDLLAMIQDSKPTQRSGSRRYSHSSSQA